MSVAAPARTRRVHERVWRLSRSLGSVDVHAYLVLGRRAVLVDAGLAGVGADVAALLRAQDRRARLDDVLVTHGHWDHVGGAGELAEDLCARVWGHPDALAVLRDPELAWSRLYERYLPAFVPDRALRSRFDEAVGGPVPRPLALRAGEDVNLGDGALRAVAAPGHTSDSLALWWPEEGVLFTGDAVAGAGASGALAIYDDAAAYARSLDRLAGLAPALALPAHADPLDRPGFGELVALSHDVVRDQGARVARLLDRAPAAPLVDLARAFCHELGIPLTVQALLTVDAHRRPASQERQ